MNSAILIGLLLAAIMVNARVDSGSSEDQNPSGSSEASIKAHEKDHLPDDEKLVRMRKLASFFSRDRHSARAKKFLDKPGCTGFWTSCEIDDDCCFPFRCSHGWPATYCNFKLG